ncbi:MAG: ABC transporter permease, partial [Actinobacteria bacterium]|nr:ABC transporter permease [Actinomycetota bacterium]
MSKLLSRIKPLKLILFGTFAFLYIPIFALMAMSFNGAHSPFILKGFSFKWYSILIHDSRVIHGLINTLIVATGSTILSTILGTMLAV